MFEKYGADLAQMVTAGLGGLISIMLRHEVKGAYDVIWGVAGSVFAGKTVAWLCAGTHVNNDLTMFFVSIAGWVGANEAMKFFQDRIKSRYSGGSQATDVNTVSSVEEGGQDDSAKG